VTRERGCRVHRSSSRVATVAIALGVAVWSSAARSAQTPNGQPAFRGGVELIQLDVSVLDARRRPVTGLNASDFTILDNGVQRPVRAFTPILLPPSRPRHGAAPPAVSSDVVTNQVGEQGGRLVIILMDRSIPVGQPTVAARKIATAAVEALGPNDLAALVATSPGTPQNLTADRARLIRAINDKGRDWSTGPSREAKDVMVIPDDPLSDGRCLCGLCVLETLTRVSDALRNTPRRHKVLLFIGSSIIVQADLRPPSADVGCDYRVNDARRKLFDSLALSHLTVHSIDPSGLASVGPQSRAGAPGGKPGQDAPVVRRQQLQMEIAELLGDQGTLHVLPDLTGGRAVVNTNVPEEKVPEIFGESDAYYMIGFEPATPGARDTTRSIEVRVARDGVRVTAQRHYMVQTSGTPPAAPRGADGTVPLDEALRGLLPDARRPLTLGVAAFAGSDNANAMVTVNVDVGAFADAGAMPMPLVFAVAAFDQAGRQVAIARDTATVTFAPATSTRRAEANVQTHINVKPGDYDVRVAVSDPATGVVASVFGPVTVPPFGSSPLSLSDVIVETEGGAAAPPSAAAAPSTTTRRLFEQNERVRALVQVYQGTQRTDGLAPVSVQTRILDANSRAVRDQVLALTGKDFTNRRAALALDIGQLPPGEYILTIDASRERQKANRSLRFAVQ
jgi:VWFA-related protein